MADNPPGPRLEGLVVRPLAFLLGDLPLMHAAFGLRRRSCAQQIAAGHGFPWLEGLELQYFNYHLALFLVAGPNFFLCLPCFYQSELRGGDVTRKGLTKGPSSQS
eukprot:335124-Pelagomonas_calceolata.AAC.1